MFLCNPPQARRQAGELQLEVEALRVSVGEAIDSLMSGLPNGVPSATTSGVARCLALGQQLAALSERLAQAAISQSVRDRLREVLNGAKKLLDDRDKSAKASVTTQVTPGIPPN